MEIVLDACSLVAFFQDEPVAQKVSDILTHAAESEKPVYLGLINWGEVYYVAYRNGGKAAAEEAIKNIESLPIEVVPADQELVKLAAEIKANHKMSYADAFAAALAKQKKAQLVTCDKEFRSVEDSIKILWL